MAQNSTTILASKSHRANITGTVISFTQTGTEYKISSSDTGSVTFSALKVTDPVSQVLPITTKHSQ